MYQYIKGQKGAGIVYCISRKTVDKVAEQLQKDGIDALPYHAGMNDQPWRIVNEYLYFNQTTSSLTIPIITDALCTLAIDDPICHVRPVNPMITLQNIKGKRIFYNQNPHFTSFFLSTDIYIFSSLRSRTK